MNQLAQKYLQSKSSAFLIKHTKKNRLDNLIRDNLDKKLEDWKIKSSPYEQKLLTAQQRFRKRTRKTSKSSNQELNTKTNIASLKTVSQIPLIKTKASAENILFSQNFNLFKDEISYTSRNKCLQQFASDKKQRVRSALNLRKIYKNTNYLSRPISGLISQANLMQDNTASRTILPRNDTQRCGFSSQRKRIKQIIIFEKGIVMKDKK